jgi:hypothetical protein
LSECSAISLVRYKKLLKNSALKSIVPASEHIFSKNEY